MLAPPLFVLSVYFEVKILLSHLPTSSLIIHPCSRPFFPPFRPSSLNRLSTIDYRPLGASPPPPFFCRKVLTPTPSMSRPAPPSPSNRPRNKSADFQRFAAFRPRQSPISDLGPWTLLTSPFLLLTSHIPTIHRKLFRCFFRYIVN